MILFIDNVNSVKAILDANRNSLMLLDLKFSIGTLGFSLGAFIASLYGMNLENFIEESRYGFGAVSVASLCCAVAIWTYGLRRLRRVQRVSMWGERDSRSRGQWTDIHNPSPTLPGESRMERQKKLELARVESGERYSEAVDTLPAAIEGKPGEESRGNVSA